MDNGRPPYGGGSPWGQQPASGQNPQGPYATGQYPVQTPGGNSYQQPYAADANGQQAYQQPMQGQPWQPQTYQPQSHQAQESYQQQSWQPYQQPYQQPYGQPAQGNSMYQTASYNSQPLQQGYAQQSPQQPVPGQFYPAQGYSGYVSAPKGQEPSIFSLEVIMKVVVFGVLPVLFLLGVIFRWPVLCVLFILAAAGAMVTVWLKDLMEPNMRLVSTLVCGAMGVLSLVVLLLSLGGAQEQPGGVQGGNAANASGMGNGMLLEQTATPTPAPTPTVDPYAEAGAAVEQLQSFFYFWHVNNDESMLALTAPSWRNSVSDPKVALFELRKNRTPLDDCEITISGSEQDTMRKAKVKVSVDKNNGREPERYSFDVIMLKEDGWWYVDPRSLESNEKETENTPATNTTPTQPPLNTGSPYLTLYYNPDGGSLYHIDANCIKVGSKYKPLKGKFLFSQLNDAPYSELEQCPTCGAPLREN